MNLKKYNEKILEKNGMHKLHLSLVILSFFLSLTGLHAEKIPDICDENVAGFLTFEEPDAAFTPEHLQAEEFDVDIYQASFKTLFPFDHKNHI